MKKDKSPKTIEQLLSENEQLKIRLQEAEDTLQAIREGAVDAIVVSGSKGEQIFTLTGEEQIYRRLVETMGEGGLTTTTEGKILFCNRQFGEMVALPMQEIVGQNLENFVKKSDRRNMAALLVGAQLKPSHKRLIFESADGTFVPAWVSANLLEMGDSISVCLVAMDQTKLEASEETIRQISEQKEELMSQREELIAQQEELRSQNDQLTESEASLHKLNRVLKALSSSNQAMMRAADETHYLQEVCNVIDKDCGYAMVWIGYARDDEARTVRPMASAGFEKGYLETLNITWANTERGRGPTGTAIRTGKVCMCKNMLTDPAFEPWRKEARKQGFASSIALPLLTDGRVFGAITIYSKQPDPFSKEEVNLLTELAGDLSYGITAIKSNVERNKAEEQLKIFTEELKRKNYDLEQALAALNDSRRAAMSIAEDELNARRRAEMLNAELKCSNKEFEEFAALTSHDLREPLRAVTGFIGLLDQLYKDKWDDKAREYIQYATNGAKRMDDLIKGLLLCARVQTRGQEPSLIPTRAALRLAIEVLQTKIDHADAKITSDELPDINADGHQIADVFTNLIDNAIKFRGKSKPKIHVGCQKKDGFLQFSVSDNGVGIDKQFHERIFKIFQRLHSLEQYPGYGVGLTICQKIVERHGGKIWVDSKPGKGATFFFTIPADTGK